MTLKVERHELGVHILQKRLHVYYDTLGIFEDDDHIYRVHSLTVGMIGSGVGPKLKTKAAESRTLLGWILELLKEFRVGLDWKGALLLIAVESLLQWHEILRIEQRRMPVATRCKIFELGLTIVNAYAAAEGHCVPKFHLFVHLCFDMCHHQGNARFYHTYCDESLNGRLARIGNKVHPVTFASSIWRRVLFGDGIVSPSAS